MKIIVNGEEKKLESSEKRLLLSESLELMGYRRNSIVVELNDLIVNTKKWDIVTLKEGDKLEIVSIVGGG
mgnify:CR=1 FL=1